jgi:putative transposase
MANAGLYGVSRRPWVTTTVRDRNARPAPDLVGRNFVAPAPNRLWVADITYTPTWAGFLYLAVVLDVFSRRIVGWAMETYLRTELVLKALNMALGQRRPAAVIHHSDQGSQYASGDYTDLLKAQGCQISMSHKASPWENAGCESWMKTLKAEEVYRQEYRDLGEVRALMAQFIDAVYNQKRLHSALGYRPPVEFEQVLAVPSRLEALV